MIGAMLPPIVPHRPAPQSAEPLPLPFSLPLSFPLLLLLPLSFPFPLLLPLLLPLSGAGLYRSARSLNRSPP